MTKSEGEGASAEKLDEAIDHLCQGGRKCLARRKLHNFPSHFGIQNKMTEFLMESAVAIEVLHDCIWEVVMKVMEDAEKPAADGLGITLCLVDMLPTVLLQLAFNTATPGSPVLLPRSILLSLTPGWTF